MLLPKILLQAYPWLKKDENQSCLWQKDLWPKISLRFCREGIADNLKKICYYMKINNTNQC